MVLKNIAPTSVYAEQAFSVASSFVPNRRSRLTDLSIDDLCFKKAYFDNNGYWTNKYFYVLNFLMSLLWITTTDSVVVIQILN